jgi:starvation-inducible outer membrane lipoprotein
VRMLMFTMNMKLIVKLALGIGVLALSSCLKLPVELSMNKSVEFSEEKMSEIRNRFI